jgi:two-component system sensor histidine kinase KdpD
LLNIIVEDAGAGFRDVSIKDVFDKFSRSKDPKTSRPGLGLSIVKGFTEAMSGTVDLEKVDPQGCRFVISIPVKTSLIKLVEV